MAECNRVIVRHVGPRGRGVPNGGTTGQLLSFDGWVDPPDGVNGVTGPASSTNNHIATFNGTGGKVIKDSGVHINDLATTTQLSDKVDKVAGKGLSTNDFTTALRNKLNALGTDNYRGQYSTLSGLTTAVPAGLAGDYALVGSASTLKFYVWDDVVNAWANTTANSPTGQALVDLIFNTTDAAAWSKANTRIFTTAHLNALNGAASMEFVNSLALQAGLLPPAYGQVYYLNTTGVAVPITSISNGNNNLVKAPIPSTLDAISTNFDSPVIGRLRYTSAAQRNFSVHYSVSIEAPASSMCVVALAKNGSSIAATKTLIESGATPTAVSVSSQAVISLATNEYLELLVGNMTNTDDITVISLKLSADNK